MRPDDDPEVQRVAHRFETGEGVAPWPEGLDAHSACAILAAKPDGTFLLAWADGHDCDYPHNVCVKAAQELIEASDSGYLGDGWADVGHGMRATWITARLTAARMQTGTIPVSEMPPLD